MKASKTKQRTPTRNCGLCYRSGRSLLGPLIKIGCSQRRSPIHCRREAARIFTKRLLTAGIIAWTVLVCPSVLGGVYKCTSPDGEIYFSDVACPIDYSKQELHMDSAPAYRDTEVQQYDPYSVTEQARRIEEQNERRRARIDDARAVTPTPGTVNRAELSAIEDKLRKVEKKILDLTSDMNGQTGIRARWTREELAEAKLARTQLLRERENVLGVSSAPREQNEAYQAKSQEAELRARSAEQRAQKAEQRARRIEQEAQTPRYNPKTGQWCQQLGGTLNCW